jgi:phosphoglycolate phosphatase
MGTSANSAPRGALIFDLDGTLVDTSGDIVHSSNYLRTTLGLAPLPATEVLAAVGHGAPHLLERLTGVGPDAGPRFEELLTRFRAHYLEHQTERSQVYPGIRDCLERAAVAHRLYVLSNKPHVATVGELEGQGLAGFFRGIWGAGALAELKPDPIGIATALADADLPASRAMMIGDMGIDVETGRRAGVRTCRVTWGFPDPGAEAAAADWVVDDVPALARVIDKGLATGGG